MMRFLTGRYAGAALAAVAAPAVLYQLHNSMSVMTQQATEQKLAYPPAPALDPQAFKPFKLSEVKKLTHDTKQYTFAIEGEDVELGLEPASLLLIKADVDGKAEIRPYTPTSPVRRRGSFDLIVKTYPEGKASKYLDNLKPGAFVEMKGPIQKFKYVPNQWEAVGMIAGGTGITPMYQLLQTMLTNPRDRTEIRLVYASRSPSDIILKTELDALAAVYPNFKVTYIVDEVPAGQSWSGKVGRMDSALLVSVLPPPPAAGADAAATVRNKVLVCGPPGMMKAVSGEKKSPADQGELTGMLSDLHYTKDTVYKF